MNAVSQMQWTTRNNIMLGSLHLIGYFSAWFDWALELPDTFSGLMTYFTAASRSYVDVGRYSRYADTNL